jgi:acetylornithine deacetylase/succinyl-diaminopimelate desuccinylase-like protein
MTRTDLDESFHKDLNRFVNEWKELLAFPSISTDPAHENDCIACAEWLTDHLRKMGFESRLLQTPSKPVVFAERKGQPDKPVVLFYGHYDVQPTDPDEAWLTPPFEPTTRNNRIFARGAVDDKGQLFSSLKAMQQLISNNTLNSTVKIVLEGEEESGSAGMSSSLDQWTDLLKADVLMVADTNTVQSGAPTLIMGLRGIIHLTAVLSGPHRDLHSGVHGGIAPNPAQEMTKLLASLHRRNGRIAVPGFYDSVKKPSARERALARAVPFDARSYESEIGVPPTAGETRFAPAERVGFRPSLDINGIHAGYNGAGIKTIIPSHAVVKITARLVPGQDPEQCLAAIVAHLKNKTPSDLHITIEEKGCAGPGFRLDPKSPLVNKAWRVLDQLGEKKPVFFWEGASIPIVEKLSRVSGAEPLLVGFGMEQDNAHAPNESFSIDQFKLGYLYTGLMLATL